jgi:hypothetical protein
MFIVVILTTSGRVCESYPTYEEALRRVELFPAEGLISLPLIFQELPDGSQRLVREDGKPLQWHRVPEEEDRPTGPDVPLPLTDVSMDLGRPFVRTRPPDDEDDGPPLPLADA